MADRGSRQSNLATLGERRAQEDDDRSLAGGTSYTRQVELLAMGAPRVSALSGAAGLLRSTPEKVTIIAQMDHQVRHVYLNVPHSVDVKPSWYGESVGHYEGDTLVVDTIGIDNQTWVDNFRTPHGGAATSLNGCRWSRRWKGPCSSIYTWRSRRLHDAVERRSALRQTRAGVCRNHLRRDNPLHLGQLDPIPEAKAPDF